MVQFFHAPTPRSILLKEQIGQSLGQGLSDFMGSYFANKSLENVLSNPNLKNAPLSEKMSRLQSALAPYGETGQRILQAKMQAFQQESMENEQDALGKISSGQELSKKDLGNLRPETQLKVLGMQKAKKQAQDMNLALKKAGVPDEFADQFSGLYEAATEGGKTQLLGTFNDLLKRGKLGFNLGEDQKEEQRQAPGEEDWKDFPELPGMTPGEKAKVSMSNQKINTPVYSKTIDMLNGLEDEARNVQLLQQLEPSLPEGLEKWDVDWKTGEPRFSPSTLTPEAQLYVKTIATMLGKAKDFFPGRVTNFDLQTFRQRFPTLANSKEGRILIAKQLELANKIAYLKEDKMRQAIEHYGPGADPIRVKQEANRKYREEKGVLEERLKSLDGLIDQEYRKRESEKVKQGTPLTQDVIAKYVGQTDPSLSKEERANQAAEMARKAGYEF